MNNTDTKQARFEKLLDTYAIALHLTYQVLDSGLLEKKIKVGNRSDDISATVRYLIPAFACDLRQADLEKEAIKDIRSYDEIEHFGTAVELATAYFDELQARGNEWESADLEDLFMEYKVSAEKQLEEDRDN
jgi:hypothetical protein